MPTELKDVAAGADVFFLLMGAILVFAMHGGFAFLEVGTVRHKNQVNALVKIIVDFAISTVVYFFIGYGIAYGVSFLASAEAISGGAKGFDPQGLSLVKFFFLCTFAAAIPAIVSGGIAERARFWPQCIATGLIVHHHEGAQTQVDQRKQNAERRQIEAPTFQPRSPEVRHIDLLFQRRMSWIAPRSKPTNNNVEGK